MSISLPQTGQYLILVFPSFEASITLYMFESQFTHTKRDFILRMRQKQIAPRIITTPKACHGSKGAKRMLINTEKNRSV